LTQLFGLLSLRARIAVGVTTLLLVLERLVLAAGVFGLAGRFAVTWAASAGVVVLWAVRGLVRQSVTRETREKLTMLIAGAALEHGGDGSFLPGEEADAAVFEGRNAAEQVIVRHAPPLVGEPIAVAVLLIAVKPAGIPVLMGLGAVTIAAVLVALLRNMTVARQRGAWRKYMDVARDTLTSIRAAPELVASGHEGAYLERLRSAAHDWTETAARAERNVALFQRIPFAAVVVVAIVLVAQTQSLELGQLIHLGVFFPPLAGMMRTAFELVRTAPRVHTLGTALDARERKSGAKSSAPPKPPPELPCEIRFEGVSFSYGDVPVLKDVSFVWKPGEVLGVKGPNGSGKSTLLKLILGLLQPTDGRVLVGGIDLREVDLPAWRRGIAYLPQRPYLPEKATVIEAMRLTVPGLGEEEARKALEETGVWGRMSKAKASAARGTEHNQGGSLDTRVALLSAGMRQKVMLARVWTRAPALFVLDEADETLDQEGVKLLMNAVHTSASRGGLVLATHHDQLLAATRVVDLANAGSFEYS
jgi:ABC-type bacteriocin/lantibiotic exporter with double-glycine peptidase domain